MTSCTTMVIKPPGPSGPSLSVGVYLTISLTVMRCKTRFYQLKSKICTEIALLPIFQRHPEWATKHYGAKRLQTTTKSDYSNPKEWDADKLVLEDVDIVSCWIKGRHKAALLLLDSKQFTPEEIDFKAIENEGSSMLKPRKIRVGVKDDAEYDWSLGSINNENQD